MANPIEKALACLKIVKTYQLVTVDQVSEEASRRCVRRNPSRYYDPGSPYRLTRSEKSSAKSAYVFTSPLPVLGNRPRSDVSTRAKADDASAVRLATSNSSCNRRSRDPSRLLLRRYQFASSSRIRSLSDLGLSGSKEFLLLQFDPVPRRISQGDIKTIARSVRRKENVRKLKRPMKSSDCTQSICAAPRSGPKTCPLCSLRQT